MSIDEEIKLSEKKYSLEFDDDSEIYGKILTLNIDNVAKVEAMIKIDSAYSKCFDKNAKPTNKYDGSSAYWFNCLNEKINQLENRENSDILLNNIFGVNNIIKNIVNAIDRENSTHLNSDKIGRELISDRILQLTVKNFYSNLKNPDKNNLYLFNTIAQKTEGGNGKNRINPSFASKFCHYACFNLLENTKEQDNYSIYDNIVKSELPRYAKKYNISLKKNKLNDYAYYRKIIDEIIKESGNTISRNGFDHLLWYYHKGQ